MAETANFPYVPDYSTKISVEPRVSKIAFGDGYAQRAGRGLNTMLEAVALTFSGRTDAEAAGIVAFLESRGGTETFTAQIGFSAPIKKYVTEGGWERSLDAYNDNTVTVSFQEVP